MVLKSVLIREDLWPILRIARNNSTTGAGDGMELTPRRNGAVTHQQARTTPINLHDPKLDARVVIPLLRTLVNNPLPVRRNIKRAGVHVFVIGQLGDALRREVVTKDVAKLVSEVWIGIKKAGAVR